MRMAIQAGEYVRLFDVEAQWSRVVIEAPGFPPGPALAPGRQHRAEPRAGARAGRAD